MNRLIYLLLLSIISVFSFGQTVKTKKVHGGLENWLTGKTIVGVKAELMTLDSVVIDTCVNTPTYRILETSAPWAFDVAKEGKYIVRFTKEGYETAYKNINVVFRKREKLIDQGYVKLRLQSKEQKLGEATVRATRVKFYAKGDTIIYNADAFKLAEGSMLDALIRQLPGAELKDDGRIFVNGKFIENLMLNGKDFFKNDRSVMLDNLPSYMVKDIKVYEKEGELSAFTKRNVDDKKFVMDVNLKKQYSIGWIANAEGGVGSESRYMGRFFALRFTPQSRLSFFGNMNNLNDSRKPGNSGEWSPSDLSGGLKSSKIFGIDYSVEDKRRRYKVEGNSSVAHINQDEQTTSSTENFLSDGNTFGRSRQSTQGSNTKFSGYHRLEMNLGKSQYTITPSMNYENYRNAMALGRATFMENPDTYLGSGLLDSIYVPNAGSLLRRLALNRSIQMMKNNGHNLSTSLGTNAFIKMPHKTEYLSIDANISYGNSRNRLFRHSLYDYPMTSTNQDFRNEYSNNHPNENYSYSVRADYWSWTKNQMSFVPFYEYRQNYRLQEYALYRLDELEGWGANTNNKLGALPSVVEEMERTIDANNSYRLNRKDYIHRPGIFWKWEDMKKTEKGLMAFYTKVELPLNVETNKLNYLRGAIDTLFSKQQLFFNPSAYLRIAWGKSDQDAQQIETSYNSSSSVPAMSYMIDDYRDDSNPLNIVLGNSKLKNTHSHSFNIKFLKMNAKRQMTLSGSIDYNIRINALAMGYVYDKVTGVRVTTPDNVNGNYDLSARVNYSFPVDKKKRLTLSTGTEMVYYNSVDLIGILGASEATRRTVRSTYLTENLKLDYRIDKIKLGTKFSGKWVNATSRREDFSTINAFDFNYGLTGQVELPWSMQVSTDLTVYCRRGYEDKAMNTNDLVWNARLSKRVMKGNLTFMLDGFDILGNLSNITHTINTQGRTETYRNVIPSYVMLHAIYRLNIQPKKRPGE